MTPADRHVGRRIRGKRRALGLPQAHLAGELGVPVDKIEAYERGTERVPAEHLVTLAEFFDVPISYFFPTGPCPQP